jgi:hypothetical protein
VHEHLARERTAKEAERAAKEAERLEKKSHSPHAFASSRPSSLVDVDARAVGTR